MDNQCGFYRKIDRETAQDCGYHSHIAGTGKTLWKACLPGESWRDINACQNEAKRQEEAEPLSVEETKKKIEERYKKDFPDAKPFPDQPQDRDESCPYYKNRITYPCPKVDDQVDCWKPPVESQDWEKDGWGVCGEWNNRVVGQGYTQMVGTRSTPDRRKNEQLCVGYNTTDRRSSRGRRGSD